MTESPENFCDLLGLCGDEFSSEDPNEGIRGLRMDNDINFLELDEESYDYRKITVDCSDFNPFPIDESWNPFNIGLDRNNSFIGGGSSKALISDDGRPEEGSSIANSKPYAKRGNGPNSELEQYSRALYDVLGPHVRRSTTKLPIHYEEISTVQPPAEAIARYKDMPGFEHLKESERNGGIDRYDEHRKANLLRIASEHPPPSKRPSKMPTTKKIKAPPKRKSLEARSPKTDLIEFSEELLYDVTDTLGPDFVNEYDSNNPLAPGIGSGETETTTEITERH